MQSIQNEKKAFTAKDRGFWPKLKKADLTEDVFNNRINSDDEREKKTPVKLRISKACRSLNENLQATVEDFLSKNRSLEQALKSIPVAIEMEEGKGNVKSNQLIIRHFSTYINWLYSQVEDSDYLSEDLDPSFLKVQNLGKDSEMRALYESHQQHYFGVRDEMMRHKQATNFYYAVTPPPSYSFN